MNAALAGMLADMDAAGFTRPERVVFLQAIDKPATSLTADELDLLDRFEAAVGGTEAGAA